MDKSFTNGELFAIYTKLEEATSMRVVMPPKVAYKIVKNKTAIKRALEPFTVTHDQIVAEISGGKQAVTFNDNPRLFNEIKEAVKEIEQESVTVNIEPIKLDDLPETGVPISFISALDFMIEEA